MPKESKTAATIRRRRCVNSGLRDVVHRQKSASAEDNLDSDDSDVEFIHEEVVLSFPVLRQLLSSQWTLFLGLVAFRVMNSLIIQTSYVPDEYWQSIEVAHNMVFGYGHMTWEWRSGLRSYSYPMLIAFIYKALAIVHLDYRILLIKLPRLMHAVFAATGDLYMYKLSYKLSGPQVAVWSLLCQLTSWFTFYTSTRTLTNSLETVLTIVGLFYFPWPGRPRKAHWKYISVVGLCIVVRPTAAVVWLPLSMWYLYLWRNSAWKVIKMLAEKGFLTLSISSIIDRIFYGKWVYVHYNFLQFNVLSNLGTFYGSHPWHWYITQGFAVIMGAQMLPFVMAIRKGVEPVFLAVIGWTVFVYSCLGHKEFRFLCPILPLAMHICGIYLHHLTSDAWTDVQNRYQHAHKSVEEDKASNVVKSDEFQKSSEKLSNSAAKLDSSTTNIQEQQTNSVLLQSKTNKESHSKFVKVCMTLKKKLDLFYLRLEYLSKKFWRHKQFVVTALIVSNLPLALYTSVLHQRGTLDVMKYVSDESEKSVAGQDMSVMYLMPCHSTPYYGYVHKNITMRFLTCEPNLTNKTDYLDEADIFYTDPKQWLSDELHKLSDNQNGFINNKLPSHFVMFNVLQPEIETFLSENQYVECARFFHSHFPEGRVGSHVIVLCGHGWGKSIKFHGNKKLHDAFRL